VTYAGFNSLEDYLQSRVRSEGHTLSSFCEAQGWATGYLTSTARGQFRMSVKRCEAFAKHFGDDPQICKVLAGHAEPPPQDDLPDAIGRLANSLRPHMQRTLLELAKWLKTRQSNSREQLGESQLYVETPDGRGTIVDVGGDPLQLDEHQLRVAVRTAVSIAMSNE